MRWRARNLLEAAKPQRKGCSQREIKKLRDSEDRSMERRTRRPKNAESRNFVLVIWPYLFGSYAKGISQRRGRTLRMLRTEHDLSADEYITIFGVGRYFHLPVGDNIYSNFYTPWLSRSWDLDSLEFYLWKRSKGIVHDEPLTLPSKYKFAYHVKMLMLLLMKTVERSNGWYKQNVMNVPLRCMI